MFGIAVENITLKAALSTQNTDAKKHNSRLLKAAGTMGLFTAVSRVLGFLRDCLIASNYGTSVPAQAFIVAFRIPNMLRDLVGEGAANSAIVPVLSRTRETDGERSWLELVHALWSRIVLFFIAVCAAGIVAAPVLVTLIAPGFRSDPELMAHSIRMTRLLFPFIGLVGLSAFFMGTLNSVHHFALPAMGPAILNVFMIAGLFAWKTDALGLAFGVLAGGVVQLLIQMPLLKKKGFTFRFGWRSHPGVSQIGRLLIPRMLGTGVYQFGVIVDTVFASFRTIVGGGSIATLYFAQRFLQLPMALFGISVAQAALPAMARQVAAGDVASVKATCQLALRSALFIAIPSSAGLIVLGGPIIETMLERGAFSAEATAVTVPTLQLYALGLASMCAVKVLANTLYAFQDTWTPVKSAVLALATNIALNCAFITTLKLPGLALATSLSTTVNAWQLYQAVKKRIGSFDSKLRYFIGRVVLASAGMGAVALGFWRAGERAVGLSGFGIAFAWLMATLTVGLASFFGLSMLLQVEEAHQVKAWLIKKTSGKN
jgi:putative peptidoglycan lipid II flippase